jgi:hypothetical protein
VASKSAPTRAEYELLKAECAELRAHVEAIRGQMAEFAKDARIQFQRTAEIQAILDEEWRQDSSARAVSHHAKPDGKARDVTLSAIPSHASRGRGPVR